MGCAEHARLCRNEHNIKGTKPNATDQAMPSRLALAVKATSTTDPAKVYKFPSLQSAGNATVVWGQDKVHHGVVKRLAQEGKEARGYKWEFVDHGELDGEPAHLRVLAGDQSLHEEIDQNDARQLELPEQHPLHICSEGVYAHPRSSKYVLHSPNMIGKYIGSFYNRGVVYLLIVKLDGKVYVKPGWTAAFSRRMDENFRDLPGCIIWAVYTVPNPKGVEQAWKDDFCAYRSPLIVKGKNKTELYLGVGAEEAEARLVELCKEQRARSEQDHEMASMELRMKHELALKDKELAIKDKDLDVKRVQLEILKVQLALQQLQMPDSADGSVLTRQG